MNNPTISFAGCGFLGIYHVGVASCIREYAPNLYRTKIAGASAGAICACALVCGCSLGDGTTQVLKVAVKARSRALGPLHPSFNIVEILRKGLEDILPEDAHLRCNGRLFISLTRVSDGKNELVSNYYNKQDLIQALICSSFIPLYSGIIPPKFHGERYVDGSLSDNLPRLDENTVTVSPFSGECDICPQDENIAPLQVFLANTSITLCSGNLYRFGRILFPAHPDVLNKLCKQGFDDALRFLHRNNLISCARCLEVTSCIAVKPTSEDTSSTGTEKDYSDTEVVEVEKPNHVNTDHDYFDDCQECKSLRHVALVDDLPKSIVEAIQAASDALDKGFANWFFKYRPIKFLSLLTSPYLLPLDLVYIFCLKMWYKFPDFSKIVLQNLKAVNHLVRMLFRFFNYERHRYSAKFSYELAITEIDKSEIAELLNEYSSYGKYCTSPNLSQDTNQELKEIVVDDGDVPMIMSEKTFDSIHVDFNVEIPSDTVDGISAKRKKMNIVEAIKATAPAGVSRPQAAIDISNKALAWEHQRLMKSENYSSCEALDQAITAPEQSEAIFSYCYLDDNSKTVKITQIYNMISDDEVTIASSSEQFKCCENLEWDESWNNLEVVGIDEIDGRGPICMPKNDCTYLSMSDDFTRTESYQDYITPIECNEAARHPTEVP